ncbi:MAG: hypothetical protein HAW59_05815, partial [Betaproteobacteria bacterium]|nr:hypothetical protein [Betaproteobacteria bacterium]
RSALSSSPPAPAKKQSAHENHNPVTSAAQIAATAHPLTFNIVAGGGTGTFWMDRNLGASQVATASDDADAYGDLYQWGRPADGHQLRGSTPTGTLALNISPGHADFITTPTTNDWTAAGVDDDGAQRQALWSSIDGSGVCPTGFRVPTADELDAERLSWSSNDAAGALASNLKLPIPALHFSRNGGILNVDIQGYYWAINFSFLSITASNALIESDSIANGLSVRCIMN